jgi:hypothetical protein
VFVYFHFTLPIEGLKDNMGQKTIRNVYWQRFHSLKTVLLIALLCKLSAVVFVLWGDSQKKAHAYDLG